MNSVVIVGRAGQDSDIKYFESGKVRTNFSLAVNRWDSKTKAEVTDWFNVDVWDKQAEFAVCFIKTSANPFTALIAFLLKFFIFCFS